VLLSVPFLAFQLDERIKYNEKLFKNLLRYFHVAIFNAVLWKLLDLRPIPIWSWIVTVWNKRL